MNTIKTIKMKEGPIGDDFPRVVHTTSAICPRCHGANLKTYHSSTDAEGVIRHTRCRTCGWKFKNVVRYQLDAFQDLEH